MITAIALLAMTASDPLAPAREGKLQCHSPDLERRTCGAIAEYAPLADGKWRNIATVRIASAPEIIMHGESTVEVEDEAICGVVSRAELITWKVTVDGVAMPAPEARAILDQVADRFASLGALGTKSCTRYRPDGDGLLAEMVIDGKPRPEASQRVIWVRPADGYQVGAARPPAMGSN